ncbi:phage tail tape measure protein, partial [Mesorhizobium sp. M2A.F.Ca.ET.067.02.1.1]|uniref:phage tail tape measure protein n=1 Tax=Mesorhizobium sp. M2A.F.Ca.ET.067.02.1.1 TaxID=2496749 RepID=UPI000FD29BE3
MAKNTIVQRIALEGGDAIKNQLKALGDAGEQAFAQIQAAALKADLAQFGASIKNFGSDLAVVGQRLALLGAGLGAAAAGATAAVFELAKSGAEAADQAGKAAEKTGLQVDAYGRLSFAAKQADVDQDQFIAGMSRLNKAISEAASEGNKAAGALGEAQANIVEGAGFTTQTFSDLGVTVTRFGSTVKKTANQVKQSGNVFKDLGIKVKDAQGNLRSTEDIIGDLADTFSKMPDGPRKSALAIELFGKAGVQLIPFLNQGREGIKQLGKEAERLGITFTKSQADIGDALGDTLDEVSAATKGIRDQLGLIFAPGVTALAAGLRDIIVQNKDAILAFGRALNQKILEGIRDLLFALIGKDDRVRNPWILIWRDAILQFGRDVAAVVNNVVLPLFKGIRDGAQKVAEALNAVFGTNITGGELLIGAALLQLLGVFRLIASASGVVVSALRLIGAVVATMFSEGVIASATAFFGAIITGAGDFIGLIGVLVGWPALIVAALVGAAAAIFVFWDDIVAAAKTALAAIEGLFSAENLAALFEGLVAAGKQAGEILVQAFKLAIEGIGTALLGAGAFVGAFVQSVVQQVAGLVAQLTPSWGTIAAGANAIWSQISAAAATAFGLIVQSALALGGLLAPAWTAIVNAGSTVWTAISGAATTAFNTIATTASTVFDAVSTAISTLASGLSSLFTDAVSTVVQAAKDIASAIQTATEVAGDIKGAEALAEALVQPFRQAQAAIQQIMAGIGTLVQSGFTALLGVVNSVAAQVQSAI